MFKFNKKGIEMAVKVKVINENDAGLPAYQTKSSAGVDLFSNEDVLVEPMKPTLVQTGLKFEIPEGYEIQIRSRSGLALKNGVFVLNSPGTIDCFSEDSKIKIDDNLDMDIKEILDKKITNIVSINEENGQYEDDTILEIIDKGVKELYEIELENGKKVKLTANHLVYTKNGMKFVEQLTIKDELFLY